MINKEHKIYAEVLDQNTLDQFEGVMNLDWVIKGALMPDAHLGYSLPIGGVVATDGVISPQFVGYDIGCGMCAAKIDGWKKEHIMIGDTRKEIFSDIYKFIPVGFNHHKNEQRGFDINHWSPSKIAMDLWNEQAPLKQVGTLGGGNHFIEIGYDENEDVWVIIHSGSRNFGWKIAQAWMKIASGDGKAREGHYGLAVDSESGSDYLADLQIGLEFALANRRHIMETVAAILDSNIIEETFINRNHNHAEFSHGMWIHRKGATHAEEGMMGVIPGNMRDGSFVVRGLGNPESLWSSSHGAGRVLGRKAAKEALDLSTFESDMAGIVAKVDSSTLDESAGAYKNIFDVMDLQKDLVEVVHHVKPLINIKG